MADVTYKGRTSGAVYRFDIGVIPDALVDANGNQTSGMYNNELVIPANRDGSVLNPQAMGVPTDAEGNALESIYNAYVHFPAWWTQTTDQPF